MATNILTGGTASASSDDGAGNVAANASDGNIATYWRSAGSPIGTWWKYDLGAGVTKIVTTLGTENEVNGNYSFGDYNLDGSNNDSSCTTIYSGNDDTRPAGWVYKTFANTTAYRYYRIIGTSANAQSIAAVIYTEFNMFETQGKSYGIII